MKSPVSIALFFLLSGLFLSLLIGAIERSRKLLAVAGVCFAGVACIIVLLNPIQLPDGKGSDSTDGSQSGASTTTMATTIGTSTTVGPTAVPTGGWVTTSTPSPATTVTTLPAPPSTVALPTTVPVFTVTTGGPIAGQL